MKFDPNWILGIIGIAAVVSPILTALINNHHQKRLRLLELKHDQNKELTIHARELIEAYLYAAGEAILKHKFDAGFSDRYYHLYYQALFSSPPKIQVLMEDAHNFINNRDAAGASTKLSQIAKEARIHFLDSYYKYE